MGAARRLGVVVLVGGVLASVVAIVLLELHIARAHPGTDFDPIVDENGLFLGLTGLVMTSAALVVLRARSAFPGFGWALAGVGLFWTLDGVAQSYVRLGVLGDEPRPGMTFAVWFLFRLTAFLPLTVVILPLLFPRGRFLPGGWRVAAWTTVTVMSASALAYIVAPYDSEGLRGTLPPGVDPDPTTVAALEPFASELVDALGIAAVVLGLVVPLATVVTRYRRASGVDRDRMRWLLWSVLVSALLVLAATLVREDVVSNVALFLVVNLVPVAMAVAVVNPDLVPIEDLLGRTLVYGALSLVLVAVDLAVLAVVTRLLDDSLEQAQVVLLVLLLTVLLYGPLRTRLGGWVRRLVLGDRERPYDVVAGLASTLESAEDGAAQLAAVARAVAAAFGIDYVCVEVDRGGGERLTTAYGVRPPETRTLPITYRDVEVGRLVLPRRGLRTRLSGRDEQLLGDLVRQAATVARTSRLAEELQDSRERLIVAREEERRRIRRDLHDGLGPALSGVVFQLESARLLVDRDPAAARSQLGDTRTHVQDVVADVRRLVHDLRPPALDDLGLAGALAQQAARTSPRTTVSADDLGRLPAAVEVAAFRIASEAMTNVSRHAGAASCTVALRLDADDLVVEVSDDGAGIATDAEAGVGLVALRERAAELGGRSEVTCPQGGGTVVRAWLPTRGRRG